MRIAAFRAQRRAVPAVPLELVLTLAHPQLQPLDGGRRDVTRPVAQLELFPREARHRAACGADIRQTQNPEERQRKTEQKCLNQNLFDFFFFLWFVIALSSAANFPSLT